MHTVGALFFLMFGQTSNKHYETKNIHIMENIYYYLYGCFFSYFLSTYNDFCFSFFSSSLSLHSLNSSVYLANLFQRKTGQHGPLVSSQAIYITTTESNVTFRAKKKCSMLKWKRHAIFMNLSPGNLPTSCLTVTHC